MFRNCLSHSDQSQCVSDLGDACKGLRLRLNCPDHDARTVALNNIESFARYGQMILNLLDSWTKGDDSIRAAIPQLIGLTTVTQEGVTYAGNVINKSSKLSLVMLSQFQIENLFRNINIELGIGAPRDGFYKSSRILLDALGLPREPRLDILNVSARLRNSLHSNGIHHRQRHDEPPSVPLKSVTYEFIDGQPVTCADWQHIAHALECSIEIVEEILLNARVLALPAPIRDSYVWTKGGFS